MRGFFGLKELTIATLRIFNVRTALLVSALFVMLSSGSAHALAVPSFKGYINDYADMISAPAKTQIHEQLAALERSDSTQIYVLTILSLEGEAMEEFAIKVFDSWKPGQKGKDNGVLLIVAQKERKVRIEVGRGLEGKLTDLAAGRIIDTVIKPKFKNGDFEGGFTDGVAALVQATRGEFKAQSRKAPVVTHHLQANGVCAFLLGTIAVIAAMVLSIRRGRSERNKRRDKKKALAGEFETDWGLPLGLGVIAIPALAYLTILSHEGNGRFSRMSLLSVLAFAGIGFIIAIFVKVFAMGVPRDRPGHSGAGGSWGGGDSYSGGGYGDSGGGGGDSGGGGGDSGGGGASGDY